MTTCKSCSAPLMANTNVCHYCGVRNDVDLPVLNSEKINTAASACVCPHCHIPLQIIVLEGSPALYIERCPDCFGLFFAPGKIEIWLANAPVADGNIDRAQIDAINQARYSPHQPVKYLHCPVCQVLMNRVNFGYRSGVVVNQCKAHGLWLESGAVTHLREWKKAGGQLLSQQHALQEKANKPLPYDPANFTQSR